MIDVHSHVLPGIDDGTKSVEEAVEFCRLARERGTEILVATPHHKQGSYENPRARVLEAIADLQKAIDGAGIALRIAPGCEVFVDTDLARKVREGTVMTYGDAGRSILLEFSFQQYPLNAEDLIFHLRLASITPVIAHPERIRYFQEDCDRLERLVKLGALSQITTSSLLGVFGSRVREISETMLRRRCVHFLASDSHDLKYRPPGLDSAREKAASLVGEEAARRMVVDHPAALLEAREIRVEEPLPARGGGEGSGWKTWLRRLGLSRGRVE